jgi:hypothetical protein
MRMLEDVIVYAPPASNAPTLGSRRCCRCKRSTTADEENSSNNKRKAGKERNQPSRNRERERKRSWSDRSSCMPANLSAASTDLIHTFVISHD